MFSPLTNDKGILESEHNVEKNVIFHCVLKAWMSVGKLSTGTRLDECKIFHFRVFEHFFYQSDLIIKQ